MTRKLASTRNNGRYNKLESTLPGDTSTFSFSGEMIFEKSL